MTRPPSSPPRVVSRRASRVLSRLAGLGLVGGVAFADQPIIQNQDVRTPPPGAASPPPPPTPDAPAPPGFTSPAPPDAPAGDGPIYPISAINLQYFGAETTTLPEALPSREELTQAVTVRLTRLDSGLAAPRRGAESALYRLSDLTGGEVMPVHLSAVKAITEAVVAELNRRDVFGIFVGPPVDEIGDDGADLREGRTEMRLVIVYGTVNQIRTVASGERLGDPRLNNPAHARLLSRSPVVTGGLLSKRSLEDYVSRLNRHPGRRVDVAVAPSSEEVGLVDVDYLVSENKPWSIYAQLSNTGTRETDEWRQRFGFVHNQVTGRDDILRFDYVTAGFSEVHALLASYEVPVLDWLSTRAYGTYSRFKASDVGVVDAQFDGENWQAGGELIGKFIQHREFFIDPFIGVRYERARINNESAETSGTAGFIIPAVGVRFERQVNESATFGNVILEWSLPGVTATDGEDIENLGRSDPSARWTILKYEVEHSFFLEPLLAPRTFRGEGLAPGESWQPGMTLAHEVAFSARGQHSFDNRLIPTQQLPIGGFFSVRGYPESIAVGDDVIVATAEYRLHVSRLLRPDGAQSGFRWRPGEPYGTADWNLLFRGFIDAGHVSNSNKLPFEFDETLVGAGIGAELQVYRNLNLRLDWGFALKELDDPASADIEVGDNRLHFLATFLF